MKQMWKQCEKCEQNVKHVKHICWTCILKNVKNAFQQCENMWKMWKSVNKCGNMLKNRKLHVLILFQFWTNNSLHSLWTYWHESLNMNICLCGILMFKFNILKFNIRIQRKPEKKHTNGAKKQELFNCLLFTFFTFFHIVKPHFHIFPKRIFNSHSFTFFTKMWKHVKKCVLKMHLEKCW